MGEMKNPFKGKNELKKENPVGQAAKHIKDKVYKGKTLSNPPAW